jgi:Tfp pilus assembly protein PilO
VNDELLIAIVLICALIGAVYILGPIARAYARRMERHGAEPEVQAELQSLRDRIGEVDQIRERMLELEERVDFAERLLARPGDQRAAALPAPEERT